MLCFIFSSHFLFLKGIKKHSTVWYLTYSKHIVPHVALVCLLESTYAEPSSVRTTPGLVCHSYRQLRLGTTLQGWCPTGLLLGCAPGPVQGYTAAVMGFFCLGSCCLYWYWSGLVPRCRTMSLYAGARCACGGEGGTSCRRGPLCWLARGWAG